MAFCVVLYLACGLTIAAGLVRRRLYAWGLLTAVIGTAVLLSLLENHISHNWL